MIPEVSGSTGTDESFNLDTGYQGQEHLQRAPVGTARAKRDTPIAGTEAIPGPRGTGTADFGFHVPMGTQFR